MQAPASRIRILENHEEEEKPDGWTRFVCFSDTHGREGRVEERHRIPADILLHGGDFTDAGETAQVTAFAQWLAEYPATHKVVIAGNHDITFDRFHHKKLSSEEARSALLDSNSCHYLEDETVELMGYRIYGSPWQPEFCDWAFNVQGQQQLEETWSKIPRDAEIVITHGPPRGIGDLCFNGIRAGCEELRLAIQARHTPIHLCGHIHEGYGTVLEGDTLFVNASTCTLKYEPTNPPIVMDVPPAAELRPCKTIGELDP
mmetsp:Transcript_14952/g.33603  ORF Transcript_14952/g.33603 Transcript_14952/m.33603 type:complete len:259 (+) Transcript_14952:70-846(+)